jgi:hypothetical protein
MREFTAGVLGRLLAPQQAALVMVAHPHCTGEPPPPRRHNAPAPRPLSAAGGSDAGTPVATMICSAARA